MAALDAEKVGHLVAAALERARTKRPRAPTTERVARIHAVLEERRRQHRSLRSLVAVGAAAGLCAAAVLLWPRAEPLRFAVGEAPLEGRVGEWVAVPPGGSTPLRFADGTRIVMAGGARARVVDVSERGARLLLERGAVQADVIPRPRNDWRVVGGPFEIQVTGTRFDASWDPDREELSVTMHHGRVVVRARCMLGERALQDQETAKLTCNAPARSATLENRAPPPSGSQVFSLGETPKPQPDAPFLAETAKPPAAASTEPAPAVSVPASRAAVVETPRQATTSATTAPPRAPPASSWRDLARANQFKLALAAAEAEGFEALCGSVSSADLMELGAAARLAGHSVRATEAYVAARRRFGGSEAAATAAFHLGQIAFDNAHAFAEARGWFVAYLAERPDGALAAEALGRCLEAEQRLGDVGAARATATRYLSRYPTGAHAALATRLLAP